MTCSSATRSNRVGANEAGFTLRGVRESGVPVCRSEAFSYKSSHLEGQRIVEVTILLTLSVREESWSSILVVECYSLNNARLVVNEYLQKDCGKVPRTL